MEKYLLVGNGIDIPFGGYENYSNSAIMSRVIKNINSGKYVALTENSLNPKEQLEMLEQFVKIIDSIKAGGYKKYADGLFMLMELDRIKRTYPERSTIESVFLEDYFLAFETFNNSFKEKDGDEKSEFYRKVMFDFLQQIMVDCIFNDGKINDIHKNAPVGTKNFLNILLRFSLLIMIIILKTYLEEQIRYAICMVNSINSHLSIMLIVSIIRIIKLRVII